nr:PREDICTED: uncharacterized protein LOC105661970 [Megachile rotundata]
MYKFKNQDSRLCYLGRRVSLFKAVQTRLILSIHVRKIPFQNFVVFGNVLIDTNTRGKRLNEMKTTKVFRTIRKEKRRRGKRAEKERRGDGKRRNEKERIGRKETSREVGAEPEFHRNTLTK